MKAPQAMTTPQRILLSALFFGAMVSIGVVLICLFEARRLAEVVAVILGSALLSMLVYRLPLRTAERKQAEQRLRESEERYRTLFEQSRDAIYIVSREGITIDVNQAAAASFRPGFLSSRPQLWGRKPRVALGSTALGTLASSPWYNVCLGRSLGVARHRDG